MVDVPSPIQTRPDREALELDAVASRCVDA
jgi:hypothetical protein